MNQGYVVWLRNEKGVAVVESVHSTKEAAASRQMQLRIQLERAGKRSFSVTFYALNRNMCQAGDTNE